MARRLPEGDRVRSITIGGAEDLATTVVFTGALATYTFQDDVTIIGVELSLQAVVLDAHLNADAMAHLHIEATRQATLEEPGALARLKLSNGWTAAITLGGGTAKELVVMYPKDQGIEVDEGEAVNLLATLNYIGAGGPMTVIGLATFWYTER